MSLPKSRRSRAAQSLRGALPDVSVVIAAGGKGRRMGVGTPKQFLSLGGVPVLERTIAAFHSLRAVREIVLVVPAGCIPRTRALVRRAGFRKVADVVEGGEERQSSVFNGLKRCSFRSGVVLVHDAVRPLVGRRTIMSVISAAGRYGAAVAGMPVRDTIKIESQKRPGFYSRTLRREELWAVQTPQGFMFPLLWEAHRKVRSSGFIGTDDASLVERMGIPVRIVPGTVTNIKITTPDDRKLAEFLLGKRQRG
ncbi:MAG TPA: 2-C-methyl-D-erythritol 4-phosphate cytidylyltransferase [Bacteroidota bacterium]